MPRFRHPLRALLTLGATGVLTAAIASPASAELGRHPRSWVRPGSTAAVTSPQTVIAVAGANGRLYAKKSTEASFRDLGGVLVDAPAVAYSTSTQQTYYVVKGTNNALYVRTDTTPFSRLVPSVCRFAPAVGISGNQLTAACIGTNYALYAGTTTLTGSGNPVIRQMVYQGGIAVGGPAISYSAGNTTPIFLVLNIHDPATGPNVSVRAATDPPGAYVQVGERCADQLDIHPVPTATTDKYFFGCRNGDPSFNSTDALYYEWLGAGTTPVAETDGVIRGRVGIAAALDGSNAIFYVTGANGHVYSKQVVTGAATGGPFVDIGGLARPGVAAATIG